MLLTGFVSFKNLLQNSKLCSIDSVDVYQLEQHGWFVIEWQPDCTETICEIWSMISGTFFNFLFVIVGNVEASAAARFLSRFAVRGLLASAKAVIMDLKQCLNPLSPSSDQVQFSPNNVMTVSRDMLWE